jgi:hypothetical protein
MQRLVRAFAGCAISLLAAYAAAAAPSDFYLSNLRRGVAEYEGGRHSNAVMHLRIAAFGLLDSIEHYETAHIYNALANDKLGDAAAARDAAQRVIAAQRIQAKYGSLQLPGAVRTAFDALAKRVLTPTEVAALRPSADTPAAPRPPAQTASQPQKPPQTVPATPTKPAVVVESQPQKPLPSTGTNNTAAPPRTGTTRPRDPDPKPVTPPSQKPATTRPAQTPPAGTTTTAPATSTTRPRTEPATPPRDPAPKPSTAAIPAPPARDIASRLAAGDAALGRSQLISARSIYRDLLAAGGLSRSELLRVAEGLYRARDFGPALRGFRQLDPLQRGEEPYRYYIAVALYETGQFAAAKKELAAALPHIEVTEDVARYRTKINSATE